MQAAGQEADDPDAKEADDLLMKVADGDIDKLARLIKEAIKHRKKMEKDVAAARTDVTKMCVGGRQASRAYVRAANAPAPLVHGRATVGLHP